jgi:hypothetical protein
MEATLVLRYQLRGSFALVREGIAAVNDVEWDSRVAPGTSKIGFVLWHCARTLDWAVNCAAAGRPEVADALKWRGRLAADEAAFGAGIPDAVADSVPQLVNRKTVLAYLTDLRRTSLARLERMSDTDLERVTDLSAEPYSKPAYRTSGVWDEIEHLSGIPVWELLARPSISHIRYHIGEVDTLLTTLRTSTRSDD